MNEGEFESVVVVVVVIGERRGQEVADSSWSQSTERENRGGTEREERRNRREGRKREVVEQSVPLGYTMMGLYYPALLPVSLPLQLAFSF